jgi:hypothetical protein
MAKQPTAAPKREPKLKPPPEPMRDRLARLVALIEERNHHSHRPALFDQLEAEEGLKVREVGDVSYVTLCSLKAQSTAGKSMALANWCNAARQQLLELKDPAA